jgi:stage V sporulation protein G
MLAICSELLTIHTNGTTRMSRRGIDMEITEVKVFPVKDNDKLKAYASIVFDDSFVIRDIRIITGTNGLFVAMPSRKKKDGTFKDTAHPLNMETRDLIEKTILKSYKKVITDVV